MDSSKNSILNKTILITGGNAGVGIELVRILSPGNNVIVIGRQTELSDSLKETNQQIEYIQMDLADLQALPAIFQAKLNSKSIDILINNAAVQVQKIFSDQSYTSKEMIDEINANFTSVCLLTKLILDINLQHKKKLDIINISSGLALVPKKSAAIYCATKAAISSLTISLRLQLQETPCKVYQALLPLVETKLSASTNLQRRKISSIKAAQLIIQGYQDQVFDHYVGQVKYLYWLRRFAPALAFKIMGKA